MFHILLAILFLIPTNGWCVTQWNKALPVSGDSLTAWPAAVVSQWSIMDTLLSSYRYGERLQYGSATALTVTSGQVVVSNSGATLRIFLSDSGNTSITSANLDAGVSFSNSTTYYVYAGATSATASSSTYYISLSSSAPTGPTYYAQLGNFTTTSAGAIANILDNNVLHFGAVATKSFNTVYQATTDGLVNVTLNCASSTCGVHILGYTDSSNPPTTVMAQCSTNYPSGGEINITNQWNGFEMRVKAGDYYKATEVVGTGSYSDAIYFTPLQ